MRKIQVRITIPMIAGIAAMIAFALVPMLAQARAQAPGALAQPAGPNSCIQNGAGTERPTVTPTDH